MVGFSETIFELLEVKSKSMTDSERCCVIVFDEMSLKVDLSYDRARDTVDGLVESCHRRGRSHATKTLLDESKRLFSEVVKHVLYWRPFPRCRVQAP